MNDKPSFDRGLLIPAGVAVFSLIGLCILLAAGRITALRGTVQDVPTATVFKYSLIGTEPAIVTVTAEQNLTEAPIATEPNPFDTPTALSFPTSAFPTPDILTPAYTSTSSTIVVQGTSTSTPTSSVPPSRTPTSASTAPFGAGTYDDLDNRLVYNGSWTMQTLSGAYQNTLHVSGTLGDAVAFRFIGQELRIFFQAGPSLGVIRLTLDGSFYDMNQANSTTQTYEWVLPGVTNGTHSVSISHLSGGSVNLDYIIVPEVPATATPTS